MTQVERPRLKVCRLYRFYVTHPLTGETVLGYVGETGRQPFERLLEHLATQPWFDTVVRWEVDPEVFSGKQAVWAAERAAIAAERPLYNYEHNLANPLRVEIWRAKEQRWARDDAARTARWTGPDVRTSPSPRIMSERRLSTTRKWSAMQVRRCLWSSLWVVIWAGLSVWLARTGQFGTWKTSALYGCLASTGLCMWLLAGCPLTRRGRRGSWRRIRRRLGLR
jgi:hypothetical protein